MIDADLLTAALLDPANDAAARRAVEALAAWDAFPPLVRAAYGREARRLAKRAAAALVELLEVAAAAEVLQTDTNVITRRSSR